ncbi:hypothetical protein [Acinetobacter sp. UBA801]|uniref:hypothetical protein n=1 Tax=Acinetobacter sp. UBA801 TaxID=1945958 RepID=UPI0025C42F72|nr:hypothetical protein [Acinetobacter sp. UBA801]
MNLVTDYINELGGYEVAKERSTPWLANHGENWRNVKEATLLEYRRQHNIFEVGDKVIKTHPKNTILWPVLGVYKNGGVWLDYKGFCWKPPSVRHATDEEIKAGKRLEVK